MSEKTTKATKADLLRMLAEAVRNTPGATELEPIREAQPGLKRKGRTAPNRVAKNKRLRRSSSRK